MIKLNFIYAFIYGCGDKKLGEILNVTHEEAKRVRERFEKELPALKTYRCSKRKI